jgi:VanZ family protein
VTRTTLARATFHAALAGVTVLSVLPVDTVSIVDLWDKLEHAIAYGVLAVLGAMAYSSVTTALRLAAALMAWGAALEVVQRFVPGRFCDPYDTLANAVGVIVGLLLAHMVAAVLGRRLNRIGDNPKAD